MQAGGKSQLAAAAAGAVLLGALVAAPAVVGNAAATEPDPPSVAPVRFESGRRLEMPTPIPASTIPTLVIAGSFDAITSTRIAEAAARPLAKGTLVVIPGVGHFVVPKSPCAQRVMASFLATPDAPDLDCIAALRPPPFTVVPR